jgi:hypothetical protein
MNSISGSKRALRKSLSTTNGIEIGIVFFESL